MGLDRFPQQPKRDVSTEIVESQDPSNPEEPFDAPQELQAVRAAPREEQRRVLGEWKEEYVRQREQLAQMQTSLIEHARAHPEVGKEELTARFDEKAQEARLTDRQIKIGHAAIDIYDTRRTVMQDVRTRYPDDNELFKATFGINPLGRVKVQQSTAQFVFRCSNQIDLVRAMHFDEDRLVVFWELVKNISHIRTHGFALYKQPRLPELQGMVVAVDETQERSDMGNTATHEEQHVLWRVLRSAARSVASVAETKEREVEPWTQLLQESKELVENGLASEILALERGGARTINIHNSMAGYYFHDELDIAIQGMKNQIRVIEENPHTSDMTREDYEKVIAGLEDNQYKQELWKKAEGAMTACARMHNIGEFSREEVAAFFDLEPMEAWPKLEKRILASRQNS